MGKVVKTIAATVIQIGAVVAATLIATAIFGPVGGSIAAMIATAVLTAAFSYGASKLNKALGLTAGTPTSQANLTPIVIRQSVSDSIILYGRRRAVNLKLVFFHSKKVGKRHLRYFVFAIAGHRIKGEPEWMLNDEAVTVDGAGKVTTGTYANAIWLWLQRGLDVETANATFVAECGGKWTANHIGHGVAAIYMKAEMTDEAVEAGFAAPSPIVKGKDDILDPRDATEKYTENAPLIAYDYMKLPREEGGFGSYPDEIPDDDWISAQANVCDEVVEGAPRYRLAGPILTGAPPSEIRDALIVNMAGSYAYVGGKHLIRPGYWVPVSVTLSEDDLAGPIQVSPFLTGDVAANEVQGTYIEPADNYQGAPFATQSVAAADVRQLDLDLAFTCWKHQAERVARIMLRRAQAEKRVNWPANIAGLKVQALTTVAFGTARYGLSNYAFVVENWGMSFTEEGPVCAIVGREENAEIYDPPGVVAPPSVPAIERATPLLLDRELANLVSTSFVTDADPPDGLLQATDTTITVEDHSRTYNDKPAVSVTGAAIGTDDLGALLAENALYHIYYDDPDRAGGSVMLKATSDAQTAANTPTQPDRHYVGSIRTDVSGGTGTRAGGSAPPSWDVANWTTLSP